MHPHLTRWLAAAPLALAAAALALASAPTHAQAPQSASAAAAAPPAAAPTPPSKVEACFACHGREGVSANPSVPNLAGQKGAYLVAQLTAFKAGERKNPLMSAIAGQLSDDDIKALAQYWSSLPAAPAPDPHAAAQAAAGPHPAIPSRMTFPANFPTGFTRYDTVPGDDGATQERWANAVAVHAAKAGQALPDGSVIIVVNRAAPTKDAAGVTHPGEPTLFTGMESRAGWGATIPVLLRNENWDYALFAADHTRRDALNQAQCLACHKPAAADSYVFTLKALKAAAGR